MHRQAFMPKAANSSIQKTVGRYDRSF